MFTIIGGDGKEYGPATAEQIRGWIASGRANLDTKAKAVGSEEWRRLGDFAEFAPESAPPPMVPPLTGTATTLTQTTLADRGARLGAWFLDNILAFLVCLPGMMLVGFSLISAAITRHGDLSQINTARTVMGVLLLGIAGLALLIVQVWMLTTRGQTVGKRLMGVRIVRLADETNPGFVSAVLLRAFVPGILGAVPYLGFVFSLVDICFIFRDDRRCIHDLIAGTKVVKV